MIGLGTTLLWGGLAGGLAAAKKFGLIGSGGFARKAAMAGLRGAGVGARAAGRAAVHPTLWGTLAGRGGAGARRGLLGGVAKAAIPFGLAAGMSKYSEDNPNISGFGHLLLGAGSFGLRASGARMIARGAVGTGFTAAERFTGKDFGGMYGKFDRKLAGAFSKGSISNWALKQAGSGVNFLAKAPFRMAAGLPYAAKSTGQMLGRIAGVSGTPLSQSLHPTWPGRGGFSKWLTNKNFDAPIGHGLFALGAGAAVTSAALQFNHFQQNGQWTMPSERTGGPMMQDYGLGIHAMKRKNYNNYGPSLTLQLHRNSTRVMPR